MTKIKMKISGSFRTFEGASFFVACDRSSRPPESKAATPSAP